MAVNHPKFQRQNYGVIKRVKPSWRKPRGIDSKQRQKLKSAGGHPRIGYRGARVKRHFHPSGKLEALVANIEQLQRVNPTTHAARLASGVGLRKRKQLLAKAKELGVTVLN